MLYTKRTVAVLTTEAVQKYFTFDAMTKTTETLLDMTSNKKF